MMTVNAVTESNRTRVTTRRRASSYYFAAVGYASNHNANEKCNPHGSFLPTNGSLSLWLIIRSLFVFFCWLSWLDESQACLFKNFFFSILLHRLLVFLWPLAFHCEKYRDILFFERSKIDRSTIGTVTDVTRSTHVDFLIDLVFVFCDLFVLTVSNISCCCCIFKCDKKKQEQNSWIGEKETSSRVVVSGWFRTLVLWTPSSRTERHTTSTDTHHCHYKQLVLFGVGRLRLRRRRRRLVVAVVWWYQSMRGRWVVLLPLLFHRVSSINATPSASFVSFLYLSTYTHREKRERERATRKSLSQCTAIFLLILKQTKKNRKRKGALSYRPSPSSRAIGLRLRLRLCFSISSLLSRDQSHDVNHDASQVPSFSH